MTIVPIPPSVNTVTDAKGIINENFGETELRLQDIEALSFMRSGAGEPQNNQFNNDDYYIDTDDYSLYQKVDGIWEFRTSLAGNPGPTGPPGSPGLNHRGLWSSASSYNINDAVRYRGSYWRAVRFIGDAVEPTTSNTTAWQVVARGLHNAGSWNASEPFYRVDDMVRYNGEWYLVLTNHVPTSSGGNNPFIDSTNYLRVVSKGDPGPQGDIGPPGPKGDTGNQGPIGAGLVNRGAWLSTTAYSVNDAVSYRGAFWSAKLAHTNIAPANSGAGATNWAKLVRGVNPMAAAWAQGASYQQDDLVPYDGSLYIVLQDHTAGATPPSGDTTNYRVYASRGLQGNQGIQGPKGDQGDVGPSPTTYEFLKFFREGTNMSGPITGTGYDRITTTRTLTAMYIRVSSWGTASAPLVVRLIGKQNGGADITIGEVTLTSPAIRAQNTSLSQVVDDTWDFRVDVVSGGAVTNLSVIARGQ